jgi:Na+-translocating ferredoxin:NAD+ oxidoreductase RnfA subunit
MFLKIISAAFYVMLFQNLIFTGGYGVTETIRMSAKPRQLLPMAIFITYFSTTVSAICVILDTFPLIKKLSEVKHAIIFSAVLIAVYAVTMFVLLAFKKISPRTLRRMGIAAFNTLVFAIPLINYRSAFTVLEAIGAGIGAGVAYIIAVILVNSGLKKLDANKTIPRCFRGTPGLFVYTALLSLGFAGISGSSIFI